jgi:hypothetical protein
MEKHKRWVITSYIIIILLWSLDILLLTPTAIATGFFEEANPLHKLGFDKFGISYSYIVYPIFLTLIISVMYLFYRIAFINPKATNTMKYLALGASYLILLFEIAIIIHNVAGLIQYAKII